ncbi:MAG: COX15/CtaA family protein [Bacteroidetes bacterium]|nr:COX15/CtaA family protein [Bacteroidota bacterium]
MNPSTNKKVNSYRRLSGITVVAVYFLILVGGIVRSTGSGMGCPDWPKCFGSVIPPTAIEQLPENYQEIYLEKRLAKNDRFVATLSKLGFKETASQLANDKSIQVEEEFNATKTWIEYINRLIGVVIGVLILATLVKSFSLWSQDKWISITAFLALVLVAFTGWIGSIVVSTNLLAWMITVHMLLALALVAVLLYSHRRAARLLSKIQGASLVMPKKIFWLLLVASSLMLVQIVLGTQVREGIDRVSFVMGNMLREEWIGKVGIIFLVHRSFSLVLLAVHVLYFVWAFKFSARNTSITYWNQALLLLLMLEIASGVGMAYFGIPAYLQPIHLLFGSLILGVQFILILQVKEQSNFKLDSQL